MGNYCCQEHLNENQKAQRKVGVSSKKIPERSLRTSSMHKSEVKKEIMSLINSKDDIQMSQSCPIITHIDIVGDLGKGGQAEIFEVVVTGSPKSQDLQEDESYALKCIERPQNHDRASSISVGSQILLERKCPFIVQGLICGENKERIYKLMKNAEGGDLSTFLQSTIGKGDSFRKLGQQGIRMVLAGIVLGLQYIHSKGLIYCDLKIQNVLIDKDGYPRLTDFDLAIRSQSIPATNFQSTLTSIGPEVFLQKTVNRGVDIWALGVLVYTLLYGETPYQKEDINYATFADECRKRENKYGLKRKRASPEILSLINSLLQVDPTKRIGYKSLSEIKSHSFFANFDWQKYQRKQLESPLESIVSKHSPKRRRMTKSQSLISSSKLSHCKFFPNEASHATNERNTKCDLEVSSSLERID